MTQNWLTTAEYQYGVSYFFTRKGNHVFPVYWTKRTNKVSGEESYPILKLNQKNTTRYCQFTKFPPNYEKGFDVLRAEAYTGEHPSLRIVHEDCYMWSSRYKKIPTREQAAAIMKESSTKPKTKARMLKAFPKSP